MRFSTVATFIIGLVPSTLVQCLAMPRFNLADAVVELVRARTRLEVLPGVSLPKQADILPAGERFTNFFELSGKANVEVVKSAVGIVPGIETNSDVVDTEIVQTEKPIGLISPPKRNRHWLRLHAHLVNTIYKATPNSADPTEGYLYCGNQNFQKNLALFCKENLFFASALTLSPNKKYLELIAYKPEREGVVGKIKDALRPEPKYLSIMRTMPDPNHRINCRFNLDLTMNQMTRFDEKSGEEIVIPEEEWNYYSSGVLYNLLFYSSAIHAALHVLHYLMCTAIRECTSHSKSLSAWAAPYDDNIAVKHFEVALLLINSKLGRKTFRDPDTKVITGKNGFGGSEETREVLKNMLVDWGKLKNAEEFKNNFLLGDLSYNGADHSEISEIIEKVGILTEASKHLANIQPFAKELTAAMKNDDEASFETAEKDLTEFMQACGDGVSSIDSIDSWVQLMSCTGILHGSTLSYSRMAALPEIMMWRDMSTKEWNAVDRNLIAALPTTVQGMTESRHVYMSEGSEVYKWNTEDMSEDIAAVLDKYNKKATELKTAYESKLEAGEDLREYGWILTDHCTDGYDGKQHTITTYI